MELNAWGAPRKMVVSDRAFGDYLTNEDVKHLLEKYRALHMKRFHYSNAATYKYATDFTDFYSYYTRVCTVYLPKHSNSVNIAFYPFIYDANNFENSPTTNKQFNKFLKEFINADISVFEVRRVYKDLTMDTTTPTLKTYDGRDINVVFSTMQYYISATNKVTSHLSKYTQAVHCYIENGFYIPTSYEVSD